MNYLGQTNSISETVSPQPFRAVQNKIKMFGNFSNSIEYQGPRSLKAFFLASVYPEGPTCIFITHEEFITRIKKIIQSIKQNAENLVRNLKKDVDLEIGAAANKSVLLVIY